MKITFFKNKIIVVSLCLFGLLACQNEQEQAQERLKKGKELLEKGDLSSAELELKSAIQGDANIADSYYTMALLNERNRNYQAMKLNLLKTIELAPENTDARLKLGKVLLLFNDVKGAAEQVNVVVTKLPEDIAALSLKAAVLIRQKNQAEALPIIDKVLQKDPNNTDAVSLKAMVYMENEDFDKALSIIEPALNANTENPSLHLLKIQLNAKRKDIDAVVKDYKNLLEIYPDKDQLKIALAKLLVFAKRPEEAESLLQQFVASRPESIEPKFVLLSLLVSLDETKAMLKFDQYAKQYNDQPKELLQLSKWLLMRKKTGQAEILLKKISDSNSNTQAPKLEAKLLLAKMAFQSQKINEASLLLEEILDSDSEYFEAKILQARILVSEKKYDEAKTLLTSILWSKPKSDETMVMLGQLELIDGREGQAEKRFKEALLQNPANIDALLPVVNSLLKKQNFGYAAEILTLALKQKPKNIVLLQKLAQIRMVEKNWDEADKILQLIAKQPNGELIATFMQGKVFQEKNEFPKAIERFKALLDKSPMQLDVMQELARSYEQLKQRPKMQVYLADLIKQNKENIPAYLVKSKLYLLDKSYSQSSAILNEAITINDKIPQLYLALADSKLKENKLKDASDVLIKAQQIVPDNLKIPLMLASIYKKNGQFQEAANVYEQLLEKNNKLDVVVNELASLLVDYFGDKDSLERARQVASRFKDSKQPFYLDTYAWTELKLNNVTEALEKLKIVNKSASSIPVFKYHLGVAYHLSGQSSIAISELQQAIQLGKKRGGFSESKAAQDLLDKILSPAAN